MSTTDLPKTYTLEEVAKALGMSERWVRRQIKLGAEHTRLGQKIRFTLKQYEALRDMNVAVGVPTPQAVTTGRRKRSA